MTPTLLSDALAGSAETGAIVMRDTQRTNYRFRLSCHYGSMLTSDTVGVLFLCSYWQNFRYNVKKREKPGFEVEEVTYENYYHL
jgi:uncharacterized Fe-S cluster-containing radical SAM superfamily protein